MFFRKLFSETKYVKKFSGIAASDCSIYVNIDDGVSPLWCTFLHRLSQIFSSRYDW